MSVCESALKNTPLFFTQLDLVVQSFLKRHAYCEVVEFVSLVIHERFDGIFFFFSLFFFSIKLFRESNGYIKITA